MYVYIYICIYRKLWNSEGLTLKIKVTNMDDLTGILQPGLYCQHAHARQNLLSVSMLCLYTRVLANQAIYPLRVGKFVWAICRGRA